jgi:hypothetical protein
MVHWRSRLRTIDLSTDHHRLAAAVPTAFLWDAFGRMLHVVLKPVSMDVAYQAPETRAASQGSGERLFGRTLLLRSAGPLIKTARRQPIAPSPVSA